MKKMRLLLILILTLIFQVTMFAQTGNVDDFLKQEMKERRISGLQAAVVRRGKIVLLKSYGTANLQNSVPVTDKSVFSINSCTKAFTGVAIMQLVEEGKVDPAAPVSRYLDGLPAAWQPVTIRQLLTHVSGIPDINRVLYPTTEGFLGVRSEDAQVASGDVFFRVCVPDL